MNCMHMRYVVEGQTGTSVVVSGSLRIKGTRAMSRALNSVPPTRPFHKEGRSKHAPFTRRGESDTEWRKPLQDDGPGDIIPKS